MSPVLRPKASAVVPGMAEEMTRAVRARATPGATSIPQTPPHEGGSSNFRLSTAAAKSAGPPSEQLGSTPQLSPPLLA